MYTIMYIHDERQPDMFNVPVTQYKTHIVHDKSYAPIQRPILHKTGRKITAAVKIYGSISRDEIGVREFII